MSRRTKNPQIYVKGYGKSATRDDLKSWFKPFGKIVCIQYKGPYSFIQFKDYYDAQTAVKQMNDRQVEGCKLIVKPSGKEKQRNRSISDSRQRRYERIKPCRKHSSSSSSQSSSDSSSSSSGSSSNLSEEQKQQNIRIQRSKTSQKR